MDFLRYHAFQHDDFARHDLTASPDIGDETAKVIKKLMDKQKNKRVPKRKNQIESFFDELDLEGLGYDWSAHAVCPFWIEEDALLTNEAKEAWLEVESPEFETSMEKLRDHLSENKLFVLKVCCSGILLSIRRYRPKIRIFEDQTFDDAKKWNYQRLGYPEFVETDPSPSITSESC